MLASTDSTIQVMVEPLPKQSSECGSPPLDLSKSSETFEIVEFDGPKDPSNPLNWPVQQKALVTLLYGCTTMGSTFATASFSPGSGAISKQYNVTTGVAGLGTSLVLIGFGFGPLLWAPLSELYGRKWPTLAPYVVATCFIFGCATSKDFSTIMIARFLAGFFGSAPLTVTGGVLADLYCADERALALNGYALAVIGGPVLGPIIGGVVMHYGLGWRWIQYITGILMAIVAMFDLCFVKETYAPVLLTGKAQRKRFKTGNWAYHSKHEEREFTYREMATKFLIRPIRLLSTPICFFSAIYAGFVYSIVYLNLSSFPIVFQKTRGWNEVAGKLPFLGLLVGALLGTIVNLRCAKWYIRLKQKRGIALPEYRLLPMMIGSIILTSGLFLIGNTANPKHFPWIAPVTGAVLMGLGFFTMFQSIMNYQIDSFPKYAASALAANTFMRSIMASVFPPIVPSLYRNLGVRWATNLPGFIALALLPIPWVFYVYGKRIRAKSKWSRQ